jgi:hypothetical protein
MLPYARKQHPKDTIGDKSEDECCKYAAQALWLHRRVRKVWFNNTLNISLLPPRIVPGLLQ